MAAPKPAARLRLVRAPAPTHVIPRTKKVRLKPLRIPTIKERPQYGPSTLEKASTALAAYALRMNRMNRRTTIPLPTREMIDTERAHIQGLQTPKEWRNYLDSLERRNEKYSKPGKKNGEIVWKEDERKSIRIGKKKGEALKQLSLTNYGKMEKLYTDPAGRSWSEMTNDHHQRMAEYVIKTLDKYHSSTKQNFSDGTYRRMKQDEVRNARIPTLNTMMARLQKRIDSDAYVLNQMKKEGRDPVMTQEMERSLRGMRNRLSILQGVERGLTDGSLATIAKQAERKRVKKKPIPTTPPEVKEGGRKIVENWSQRAREQKLLPAVTETTREKWRQIKPLTQEEAQYAQRKRDAYLKSAQLQNELDRAHKSGDPERIRIARARYFGEIQRRVDQLNRKPAKLSEGSGTPGNRRYNPTQEEIDGLINPAPNSIRNKENWRKRLRRRVGSMVDFILKRREDDFD